MFGDEYNIVRHFPEYFLDYREILDPTIRWTDRLQSSSGEWSGNICDFYFRVYNKLVKDIKVPFKTIDGNRIDDTPVHEALREALANCLINADFYGVRGIVVRKEADRIVFENPGYSRTGKQQMKKGGISDPRNKVLMKMFNLINIGERAGSGVPNIFNTWEDQGWVEPVIEEQFDPDRTLLILSFDKKQAIKTSDKKQAIKTSDTTIYSRQKQSVIEYLTREIQADCKTIADLLEISSPRARAVLTKMVKEEIIITEGGNRNRTYKLKS